MTRIRGYLVLVLALIIGGCANTTLNPAVNKSLTDDERLALQSTLAKMLNSPGVIIAPDVFSNSYILVLAPATANTPIGTIATGRTVDPDIFHLLTDGNQCVLEHTKSGTRAAVMIDCEAYQP